MATGRETRATIDSETVKGLLLINGGGVVALLAFLPGVLQKPELESLARAIIWSVFTFQIGLVCAVIHNRFRRLCSLEYAKKELDRCSFFGKKLKEPCICHLSIGFMWCSIVSFVLAGVLVLIAGLGVVGVTAQTEINLNNSTPSTISNWISILAASIVAIGWFVTGYLNRRKDISQKRLEYRLDALKSFLPVWFDIQKNNAPFTNPIFLEKLENARSNFHLYGFEDEIELMESFISACETQNLNNANESLSKLVPLVRKRIRKELEINA